MRGIERRGDGIYGNSAQQARKQKRETQGGVVSRGAVAVKYPGARVTVPDLNMHHQIKHALLGAWDAANKHPNMHTHIPNA